MPEEAASDGPERKGCDRASAGICRSRGYRELLADGGTVVMDDADHGSLGRPGTGGPT